MPIAGTRQKPNVGQSYRKDPMYKYAQALCNTQKNILTEANVDLFNDPKMVYSSNKPLAKETMRNFFVENSYDLNDPMFKDPLDAQDYIKCMNEQFENDVEAIYEHTAPAEWNPAVGMTLPMHKNIMMNMIFDKGAIQKVTAVSPKFTETMEIRLLRTPDGKEIDMFLDQNKLTEAIDATVPVKTFELDLPSTGDADIIGELGGGAQDSLDIIETYVSAVLVKDVLIKEGEMLPNDEGYLENGDIATVDTTTDVWYRTQIRMEPNFGGYERAVVYPLNIIYTGKDGEEKEAKMSITATLDKGVVTVSDAFGTCKKVRLNARLDTSNAMVNPCSATWKAISTLIEIGTSVPLNTTVSPQELKDVAAMYDVNQVTKYMSLFKTLLANYKDDHVLMNLNKSWKTMDARSKAECIYDFQPRQGYALDHPEWRHKTFLDKLDRLVSKMLQVLNDTNMTVTIFGDPDTIRRIGPTEYQYKAPDAIGQVELDYTKGVITSDKRTYHFMGSDKLRGSNDLIVILCPHNSNRIIYRIYDYQMYVSNEIRNIINPALPAINAFERWRFFEYQPVQGKVHLKNNGIDDL